MKMHKRIYRTVIIGLAATSTLSGCKKIFNVPEEKDYLSPRLTYTNKSYSPILGRTTLLSNIFNADNSSFPLKFEIINARLGDGTPVTDLFQVQKTWAWVGAYDGNEKSIAEIDAKRKMEDHPLFEVRSSGEFIMWGSATSALVKPRGPSDTDNETRFFDVKVSNGGGETVIQNLRIQPFRERPYEPHDDRDEFSGGPATESDSVTRKYIYPAYLNNMVGENSNLPLRLTLNRDQGLIPDVRVYFHRKGNGHSLAFKFMNTDSVAMDPALFKRTRWDEILHGFNRITTATEVKYDVAYPIPLARVPTKYTVGGLNGDGSQAHVEFSFDRLTFGGIRAVATMGLNFNIFQEGDWEIVFHFIRENPKFEDD